MRLDKFHECSLGDCASVSHMPGYTVKKCTKNREEYSTSLLKPGNNIGSCIVTSLEKLGEKMKHFKRILSLLFVLVFLSACGARAAAATPFALQFENPYAPQAGDSDLMAGDIQVDSASVSMAESQPPQLMVNFAYFQPTPCYKLRVEASNPDAKNQINLKAYAVAEKDKPCTLMALSTPLQASLNLGSLPKGHYTVLLNGNQIGEFDS